MTLRLLPYWYDAIVPDLRRYGCVLVVSHGNTLRALIKHLETVSDDAVSGLEVPNATPLFYQFPPGRARPAGLATPAGPLSRRLLAVHPYCTLGRARGLGARTWTTRL